MARILIVDDEEMDRLLERSMLEEEGHDLFFAANGKIALRSYGLNRIDLVITDLAMPEINGLRLIRELREVDPDARIIAVTGVSPEQLDLAEDFGAVATFTKPVKREELLEAVEKGLEGRRKDYWGS